MRKFIEIILLIVTSVFFISCSEEEQPQGEIIAKIEKQCLYKDEVLAAMPISLSEEDSVTFVKNYVDNWIQLSLLYKKAKENVIDEDSSLSKQIERFKQELYVNAYEQLFLQQKLDTLIPQKEINDYYEEHKSEYVLNSSIVKPIFIVFPIEQKQEIEKVEKIMNAKGDYFDIDELKDLCFRSCQKFSFADEWVDLSAVLQELPLDVRNVKFEKGKSVKLKDTTSVYFVKIMDRLDEGSNMPVELTRGIIAEILLQERKIELLKDMRNKVYHDAIRDKEFEVFY